MNYDPAKHHRRSIRLKGHDYAGGGVYFVTLCAHRAAGNVFANETAKKVVEECWRTIPEHFPQAEAGEFVAMPDHVHGIIRMAGANGSVGAKDFSPPPWAKDFSPPPWAKDFSPVRDAKNKGRPRGTSRTLGSVIRGFKIGVVKGLAADAAAQIWHRNYYEMIVRSEEAERKIAEYIRMNPWRCVQEFGNGLRGIGNPALWNTEKLGVLCSRNAPRIGRLPEADVYLGGWHSPKEKEILDWLLENGRRVIACPAWGIGAKDFSPIPGAKNSSPVLDALEQNRMLILEMRDVSGNLAAAEARNRFVIEHADVLFTPHVSKGGMLDRILKEKTS
jgi:putative transposase